MGRPISCVLQHGLEVLGDHPIERRRLGAARAIANRQRLRRSPGAAFEHVLRCVRTRHDRRWCACNATLVRCGDSWPLDLDGQRVDLVLLEKISALLVEREDIAGALARLRAALAAAEAVVARDKSNDAARRRDVAVLQTRIGNVLLLAKDHASALPAFRAAQAIQRRFVEEQPHVIDYQRDVSVSHANLGRALLAAGDVSVNAALEELRADLAISKALAVRDPMNATWQRDLSVSHETLADALLTAKRPRDALVEVQASLVVAKRLAARDATNVFFQAELARTYDLLVKVQTALGDAAGVAAATAEAARIRATFE